MVGVYISGIGTYIGSEKVSIEDIAKDFPDIDPRGLNGIRRRAGASFLYRFSKDESLDEAFIEASQKAIQNAGISPNDVDGIYCTISSLVTSNDLMPSLSRKIATRFGLKRASIFQVGVGCVGGLDALMQAHNQLFVDSYNQKERTYLVVIGDHTTRVLKPGDRATAFLFSEGAGSLVVTNKGQSNGYQIVKIGSTSLDGDIYCMRISNPLVDHSEDAGFFLMDGEKVFEFATQMAIKEIPRILGLEKIPKDCYFIPHQGSLAILNNIRSQIQDDDNLPEVYTDGIKNIGNLPSASFIFGLEDALMRDYIGNRNVLIGVFGAELKVGAALLVPIGDPRKVVRETRENMILF